MLNLKIITDKTINMDGLESCTELQELGEKKIDYKFWDINDNNPKFNYFEIGMNGEIKILAVSGKVEIWEIPDTATKINEVEKKT